MNNPGLSNKKTAAVVSYISGNRLIESCLAGSSSEHKLLWI